MIHVLAGGRWGNITRRFLEAGFMTLPAMAILFLPIFAGIKKLYPWACSPIVAADKTLQNKAAYLNIPGFVTRMVIIFAIWSILGFLLRKWSLQQDTTTDVTPTKRMRKLAGPAVIIYTLTVTFAFIDWVMSLEPDWDSTMFAIIICIGQILVAITFAVLMLAWLKNFPPFDSVVTTTQFHQFGNLMLAFVMFWTYVMFGQFLINWSGNTPKEIIWYHHRIAGGWKWLIAALLAFHFVMPFFLLLFRSSKRKLPPLTALAAMIFAAHILADYWIVVPAIHSTGPHISWFDFTAFFGVGGVWFAIFIALLKRHELLPRNDPRIEYA
jgi:hypothetical protein